VKDILNVMDFIKIGLMAFVFIWLMNRGLAMAGLSAYETSSN
jgi:hypothetical protein